jgi:endonuclease G, mitochondrial
MLKRRKLRRRWLPVLLAFILTGDGFAEICRGSRIRKAQLLEYDQLVSLTSADIEKAKQDHAPFGMPACSKLLPQREYLVCYDPERRVASWVSYTLRREDIVDRDRLDAFRSDPRLTDDENAQCADYQGTGYDRRHAVPRGDMNRSPEVQADTYFLSNMGPQTPELNRGMLRWLEESVRSWVMKFGELHVLSGSVFLGTTHWVASQRVAIPREFFKILVRADESGNLDGRTFVLINWNRLPVPPQTQGVAGRRITANQADSFLRGHLSSIGAISRLTGLQFFPLLPETQPLDLEQQVPNALWPKN